VAWGCVGIPIRATTPRHIAAPDPFRQHIEAARLAQVNGNGKTKAAKGRGAGPSRPAEFGQGYRITRRIPVGIIRKTPYFGHGMSATTGET
jgi:hypothetical protein